MPAMSLTWLTRGRSNATGAASVGSVISDARIEIAVDDVGDQVEDDDDRRRHDQICHHRVDVELAELVDEVVTDAVEAEHGLGDDRAAEHRAEIERRDR